MPVRPDSDGAPRPGPGGDAGKASVTWLSVGVNVALGATKCVVGYFGQSRALVADGLHSLTDLSSDAAVLFGIHYGRRPPDEKHPYGHHRAQSLVTLFIALSLLGFCAALVIDSVRTLGAGTAVVPHWPTLVVALVSIAVKEALYWRTRLVGLRLRSQLLLANAWHHRTDSVSSLVAALGIGTALVFGPEWAFLDTLVGIVLGGFLGVEGVRLLRGALDDLMDAAPGQALVDDLREHILPTPGALAYHDFRARQVGDMIEVDFHLLVPPELNVEEAHAIAARVKREILERHPEVLTVLIHVEPALPEHHRARGIADGTIHEEPRTQEGPPD
jgi:cation diffusion facilitator family transporter